MTKLANCCNPLPGDTIIGFVSRGRGVIVHRSDCRHIAHFVNKHRERLISVSWLVHYPQTSQYAQTDSRERENLMPLPTPPNVDNSNGTPPHIPSFALEVSSQHYHVPIIITAHDRSGLIRDVAAAVSDIGANVLHINTHVRRGIAVIATTLDIENLDMLYRLFIKLEKTKGVTRVERDLGKKQ